VLAVAVGAHSAFAVSQPFTATSATVTVDLAAINAALAGYSPSAVGGATLSGAGVLSGVAVQGVDLPTGSQAIDIDFVDAAGLKLTKSFSPSITLSNFSFDLANNTLTGNLLVGSALLPVLNLQSQELLTATSVLSSFGSQAGTAVTSSPTARAIGLDASSFVLAESFKTFLTAAELNPNDFTYVADLIKSIKIGTVAAAPAVPEPGTYALMGLGLVGLGLVARRKQAA
jgi:hypothetical protein